MAKSLSNEELNDLRQGVGSFGCAIKALKEGKKVARLGWNGQGMFLYYAPENKYPALTEIAKEHFGEQAMVPYRAYIALKTAQEDIAMWSPSGSDALAEDWCVVGEKVVTEEASKEALSE